MRFPAFRVLLAGGLALAGVLSLSIPSQAVSVCQKKNRIKLRADGCKAKEAELGSVAFQGEDPEPNPGEIELSGTWQAFERIPGDDSKLSDFEVDVEVLILAEDGNGRIHQSHGAAGVVSCTDFVYARGGDLVIDTSGDGEDAAIWTHELASGVLSLSDASNASASFSLANAVDPSLDCLPLTELRRLENLPEPRGSSGLAFDGSLLYYLGQDDLVHPIAAFGGDELPGSDLGSFDYVHADGGASLWGHCACGGSPEAVRTTLGGDVLNDVNVEELLGENFSVDTIASDPGTGRIWVTDENRLVEIDGNTQGGAVLSNRAFETGFLEAMAFDGTHFWVLTGNGGIAKIEFQTLESEGSFANPD
ncbi:MAG: hypothetical protein ACR2PQ_11685, partial [Myxococcota bacterium]